MLTNTHANVGDFIPMKDFYIETSRLILRAPCEQDYEDLYELMSDPLVMQYVGTGNPRSQEEVRTGLQRAIEHQAKHGFSLGSVFEKESGLFIGRAGIVHLAYDESQPDLQFGYALKKQFWNKGYATEISRACIDWAFTYLPIQKLIAIIHPDNECSRRVLEKCKLRYVSRDNENGIDVSRYEIEKNYIDLANINLIPAPLADYPVFQKLSNYYAYDISEYFSSKSGWEMPEDGVYEHMDYIKYWQDRDACPFLVRYGKELAGYVVIDKNSLDSAAEFNVAQFFILKRFQNKGVGRYVAGLCFDKFPGEWEVMVMPGNEGAYRFWRSVIKEYTKEKFQEYTKRIVKGHGEKRNIFRFNNLK